MPTSPYEKPDLEELMHYGVLGMKWGRRTKASGGDIAEARRNIQSKQNSLITQARKVRKSEKGSKQRASEQKRFDKMSKDFLKDPDRATAARMTKGEKVVSAIFLGPAGIGSIAVSEAVSRRIEQKQETGAYDKKRVGFL